MQMSIREAKARLAEAATAAAAGERVIITRYGRPFVELVPVTQAPRPDLAALKRFRAEAGHATDAADWFDDLISDPEASRRALGIID